MRDAWQETKDRLDQLARTTPQNELFHSVQQVGLFLGIEQSCAGLFLTVAMGSGFCGVQGHCLLHS